MRFSNQNSPPSRLWLLALAACLLLLCAPAPAPAADAVNPAGSTISGNWDGTPDNDNYDNQGTVNGDVDMTQGGHDLLTNSGVVSGGVIMSADGYNTVSNTGSVYAGYIRGSENTGAGDAGGNNSIENRGAIYGAIAGSYNTGAGSSGGNNSITNSGYVDSGIDGTWNSAAGASGGGNEINNSGMVNDAIEGTYNSGAGASGGGNTIVNSGTVAAWIDGTWNDAAGASGGENTIINTIDGYVGVEMVGSKNDGANTTGGSNHLENRGSVFGGLYGSDNEGSGSQGGSNTVINSGIALGIIAGSYNGWDYTSGSGNQVINSGAVFFPVLGSYNIGDNSSGGSNRVSNSGEIWLNLYGSLNEGAASSGGGNTVTNSSAVQGYVVGSENRGSGSSGGTNTITNSGRVDGNIHGSKNHGANSSGGSNTIVNSGAVGLDLRGSTNSGSGSSSTGNSITNSGTVGRDIYGSYNSGAGSSGGGDTITNSGTVGGSIYGADGDDRVNLKGGSSLGGVADGGTGNDILGLADMGTVDGSLWGGTYINFENLHLYGGTTTLTGSWNVSQGVVVEAGGEAKISGELSAATVINRGVLSGTGRLSAQVTNHGTISPGNSIGTLSISGDFTNSSSGVLEVELARGKSDLLAISGTATLNGGTVRASLARAVYLGNETWKVLSAGNIVGACDTLVFTTSSATLSLSLDTGAQALALALARKSYADFGQDSAARAMGRALDGLVPQVVGRTDGLASLIIAMDFTYSATQISDLLNRLVPRMYTAYSWASLQSTQAFSQAIGQELDQERGPRPEPAPRPDKEQERDIKFWMRLLDAKASREGGSSAMGYGQDLSGVVLGGRGRPATWLDLGGALGFTRGDLSWDAPASWGRMDNLHAGLYGRASQGAWHVRGDVALTYHDAEAHRPLALSGNGATAQADFSGLGWLAGLRAGYDFRPGVWRLGPVAGLRYTRAQLDGFNESGSDELGMAVGGQSADSLQSSLGLEATAAWELGGVGLRPRASAAWWHEFITDPYTTEASFLGYASDPFTMDGLGPPADYLALSAGLEAQITGRLQAGLELSLALGDDYYAQAVNLGLRFSF
ncbi:MAG: autotransporter domain-containing protein [Desulfarculaceae bacterium]|nr:autotransporter domain-containing protein [Desulfarculaceae bacterium]MCF8072446.1 autotransporter domain-containing protein [Desulfarculaceae bacterium]MCF8102907.1 autotransporter domain-containing protein [Desulfarculaceae bacterium]MCF8118489.1 autotransporter domain-containing protein [Desulfarculaceae bacterium]